MIAAIVSYPSEHPTTNVPLEFDMNYYLATHMPMIERGWGPFGLRSWSTVTFDDPCPLTGKKPRYRVQTTCIFGSVEELKAALAGNEETKKDVDKFCNIFPEIAVAGVGEGNTVGEKAKED